MSRRAVTCRDSPFDVRFPLVVVCQLDDRGPGDGGKSLAEPLLVLFNGHFNDALPTEFNGGADVGRADLPRA